MKEIDRILNNDKTIIFIDFEGSQYSQEIIAIGAVKASLDNKNFIKKVISTFKCYIKIDEIVGDFITNLTGITDEILENEGLTFPEAMEKLQNFVGKTPTKFFHYGNFDTHLMHNSALNSGINDEPFIRYFYENSVDFSKTFSRYVKSEKNTSLSLIDALKVFHTNIETNIHDPLTDSLNLMHLYDAFLTKQNILKEQYVNVLRRSPSLPNPFRKILKKLESEQKVTYKDFITYVEEDLKW